MVSVRMSFLKLSSCGFDYCLDLNLPGLSGCNLLAKAAQRDDDLTPVADF